MIAIFSTDRMSNELKYAPKEEFIIINSPDDIHGRTFTGVIETYNWWFFNELKLKAYHLLQERQPELFK